jgi:hypothetical protein
MRHTTEQVVPPIALESIWRVHWHKLQVKLQVVARAMLVGLMAGALVACGGGSENAPIAGAGSKPVATKVNLTTTSLTTITSAKIEQVINDNTVPNSVIPNGTSTTDNTPQIIGSLSSTLATDSVVRVYDGTTVLGSVTTTGTNWVFIPSSPLVAGTHTLKAVVFDPKTMTEGSNTNRWVITVNGSTAEKGQLSHSGMTSDQCYSAGSNFLMACRGVTNDLNAQQDGHRNSINPLSFSKLGFGGETLPDNAITWCAVKDNVTGLIWQNHLNKPDTYTNWGDKRPGDASQFAADNAALCDLRNWRLPNVDELQSIVDYSKAYPGPTVSLRWFPNTPGDNLYWTSSNVTDSPSAAWIVDFRSGIVSANNRDGSSHVRLVRASN